MWQIWYKLKGNYINYIEKSILYNGLIVILDYRPTTQSYQQRRRTLCKSVRCWISCDVASATVSTVTGPRVRLH